MTTDPAWPSIDDETLPWEPRPDVFAMASRSEQRRHRGPYQAAVLPEIATREVVIPNEVAAAADDASGELARFDAEMGAEIAPFAAILLRAESAASSQIENLTASARAIAEAELGDPSHPNASQIVANTHAMDAAIARADHLDADAILAMHRALMDTTDPHIAGRWRDQQVWIGGGSIGPHRAMFVPPHHTRVEPAIADLLAFVARDDLPVLTQTALAHAQFETIHPFPDGNGRTGRALLHAVLRHKRLTRNVTVPISAGLLADTDAYFAALDASRTGDPAPIVAQVADASFRAVGNGRHLVQDLRALRTEWDDRLVARRDSNVWRIADLLLRHPVVDAPLLGEKLGIGPTNVYRHLDPLETAGVVASTPKGRHHRTWRAPEVLRALDDFAERAGRRTTAG